MPRRVTRAQTAGAGKRPERETRESGPSTQATVVAMEGEGETREDGAAVLIRQQGTKRRASMMEPGDDVALSGGIDALRKAVARASAEERYEIQERTMEAWLKTREKEGDLIEIAYNYMLTSGAYKSKMTRKEFEVRWRPVIYVIEDNRKRRERKKEANRAISETWGESEGAREWLNKVGKTESETFMTTVRKVAYLFGFREFRKRVNQALVSRLDNVTQGRRRKKAVMTGDVDAVPRMEELEEGEEGDLLTRAKNLGLRLGPGGILEEGEWVGVVEGPEIGEQDGGEIGEQDGGEIEEAGVDEEGAVGGGVDKGKGVDRYPIEETDVEAEGEEVEGETGVGDDSAWEMGEETCLCSGRVPKTWKEAVSSKTTKMDTAALFRLLAKKKVLEAEGGRVCYRHSKLLGGKLGLRVKKLNGPALQERLLYLESNKQRIGAIKVDPEMHKWFRKSNRPTVPSDSLGVYRFAPIAIPEDTLEGELKRDGRWKELIREVLVAEAGEVRYDVEIEERVEGFCRDWEEEGTVRFSLFEWWFTGRTAEIGKIVLEEYEMYRHHLRKGEGANEWGWCRSMLYSLGQQLMRQDPAYYMTYVACRLDHAWRIISYPYYTKYAVPGDNVFFRHIDINIPLLLSEGRGANMIQGSLSLDDEDDENCTELLPGMHLHMEEWWKRVKGRGYTKNGHLHRVDNKMFTRGDAEAFRTNWRKDPCRRGEVRVSLPHLPHGSNGPATKVRRTMFPWYAKIQEDHVNMEVVEGGSWASLAEAHRDQIAPHASPSGLPNMFGAIPYKFPASVQLSGLGPLSDALVGRERWDSLGVLAERDRLLRSNGKGEEETRRAVQEHIVEWRERALIKTRAAYALMVEAEKRAFGRNSYFYKKEQMAKHGQWYESEEMTDDEGEEESDDSEGLEEAVGVGGGEGSAGAGASREQAYEEERLALEQAREKGRDEEFWETWGY